jgi:hypothetical protein
MGTPTYNLKRRAVGSAGERGHRAWMERYGVAEGTRRDSQQVRGRREVCQSWID